MTVQTRLYGNNVGALLWFYYKVMLRVSWHIAVPRPHTAGVV